MNTAVKMRRCPRYCLENLKCRWADKEAFYLLYDPEHDIYYRGIDWDDDNRPLTTLNSLLAKPYMRLKNAKNALERVNQLFRDLQGSGYKVDHLYGVIRDDDMIEFVLIDQNGDYVD